MLMDLRESFVGDDCDISGGRPWEQHCERVLKANGTMPMSEWFALLRARVELYEGRLSSCKDMTESAPTRDTSSVWGGRGFEQWVDAAEKALWSGIFYEDDRASAEFLDGAGCEPHDPSLDRRCIAHASLEIALALSCLAAGPALDHIFPWNPSSSRQTKRAPSDASCECDERLVFTTSSALGDPSRGARKELVEKIAHSAMSVAQRHLEALGIEIHP